MSVTVEQVRVWLYNGGRWHVVMRTSCGWTTCACGMLTPNGEAEELKELPTRICRKCRKALKDIHLAGDKTNE